MKKRILTIALAILLIAGAVYSAGLHHYIYLGSTGVQVTNSGGNLYHVILANPTAAQENTFNIYDYASNEPLIGTTDVELIPTVKVTAGTNPDDYYRVINLNPPVEFHYGLYVIYGSTTSEWAVYWRNEND